MVWVSMGHSMVQASSLSCLGGMCICKVVYKRPSFNCLIHFLQEVCINSGHTAAPAVKPTLSAGLMIACYAGYGVLCWRVMGAALVTAGDPFSSYTHSWSSLALHNH